VLATPFALWIGVVLGTPRAALGALLALSWLAHRRGRDMPAGVALGVAAAAGGPLVLAPALAVLLAPGRRAPRALGAAAAAVAVLWLLRAYAPPAWGWSWWPPAESGGGVSLARLGFALTGRVPGAWSGMACAALALGGFAWLVRRGAEAPALAAWAFGACALAAPAFPVGAVVAFAPLLAGWCAADPDRRGWWFLESLALALTVVLERYAAVEPAHAGWRFAALLGIAAAVLLAPWPLRQLVAPGAASCD
jgi:hypothetical protein